MWKNHIKGFLFTNYWSILMSTFKRIFNTVKQTLQPYKSNIELLFFTYHLIDILISIINHLN